MTKRVELVLQDFEKLLQNGYSLVIFKGYKAINKKGAEKLINDLYSSLEEEVILAKSYLDTENISNQEYLTNLINSKIKKALQFSKFVIVNVKEFEKLIKNLENYRKK